MLLPNCKIKINKFDIKKAALDAAKDAIDELEIDVECPHCGKKFIAHKEKMFVLIAKKR